MFFYFIYNERHIKKKDNLNLIYNKECKIKNFKNDIKKYNLYYCIDNILLKINILQPIMFSIYPSNNIREQIEEIYNMKRQSEDFIFKSDNGITKIEYLYHKDRSRPVLYFTNTFGVGGLGTFYIHRMMLELNREYNCVFVYSRGYNMPINNKTIYLCNINEDLNEILNYLFDKFTNNMNYLVGISMAANSFSNYLCHYNNKRVKSLISIYNPLDLLSICYSQTYSMINNYLVNRIFKKNMKKYLLINFAKSKSIKNNINMYLDDLELFYSKFIKPYNNKKYKSFSEYSFNNSCINFIDNLEIPSLFIFADDDCVTPISKAQIEKLKNNKNILQLHSRYGSHVGHYDDEGNIWLVNLIDKYIKYTLTNTNTLK
jgi:predicted alpha/beta-fold hydrolase